MKRPVIHRGEIVGELVVELQELFAVYKRWEAMENAISELEMDERWRGIRQALTDKMKERK